MRVNRKLIGTMIVVFVIAAAAGIVVTQGAQVPLAQKPDGFFGVVVTDARLRNTIVAEGRPIDDLIVNGDVHTLFNRFDYMMAQDVPESAVASVLTDVQLRGKLEKRLGESARLAPDGSHVYMARYEQLHGMADISIVFDNKGQVSGLRIQPVR